MQFKHDQFPQFFYDCYNEFILSSDIKIFGKLCSKYQFSRLIEKIPGDIVELGVFRGTGLMNWLKVNDIIGGGRRRVFGFDFFDEQKLVENIKTSDSKLMNELFTERKFASRGYEGYLTEKIASSGFSNFELIVGDVFETVPKFLAERPGFRASLINFDLDTAEPTLFCLNLFWDRLTVGGILLFDEYGIDEWTESDAVDEFIKSKGLELFATGFPSPSAFLRKQL